MTLSCSKRLLSRSLVKTVDQHCGKVSYFFLFVTCRNPIDGTVERCVNSNAGIERPGADSGAAGQWLHTLWVMVGVQFIMTGAFSVLSPIIPLLLPELGRETARARDLWAGSLTGV